MSIRRKDRKPEKLILYAGLNDTLTDWYGVIKAKPTSIKKRMVRGRSGKHRTPFSYERIDVRFFLDGREWRGVHQGNDNTVFRCTEILKQEPE